MTNRPPPCKCGCGLDKIEPETMNIVELLSIEFPQIKWTSGSRCPKHNKAVGGSPRSGHMPKHGNTGQETVAIDGTVEPWDNWLVRRILWRAIRHGAKGIGVYYYLRKKKQNHFHLDRKPRIQFWKRGLRGLLYFFK